MPSPLIQCEITKFLTSPDPGVLCIRGAWGVGKTFAWKRYFRVAVEAKAVGLTRYAYVSLFGLNSLQELKHSIFENTVNTEQAEGGATFDTFGVGLERITKSVGTRLLANAPIVKDFKNLLESSYFLSVRDQIVCLDDLERKGTGFSLTDVLGLVAFLKEERKCKVVLLLNSDAFQGDDQSSFTTYLEKVIDRALLFVPSSRECVEIALPGSDPLSAMLGEHVVSLGISNIRVIRRLEAIAKDLQVALAPYDPKIFEGACKSMVLLAWAYYQPMAAPSLEFLTKKKSKPHFGLSEKTVLSDAEVGWEAQLSAYGHMWTDEFELAILEGVKAGYFDPNEMKRHAQPIHEQMLAGYEQNFLREAWNLFHFSFDDNEEEVLTAIGREFRARLKYVSLGDLNGAVELFKSMGRPAEAAALIAYYIENRTESESFWDLERYPFAGNLTDPDVRGAIQQRHASLVSVPIDPVSMLRLLMEKDNWNSKAISVLATTPVEEYTRILKETKGPALPHMLEAILQFRRVSNASDEMKEITKRATESLAAIGAETPLNAMRVSRYGVKVETNGDKGGA